MQTDRMLAVAAGGVAGALIRWGLLEAVGTTDFPIATLVANLAACFVLGIVVAQGRRDLLGVALATGFCGGLSTMSTFALEVAVFLDTSRPLLLVSYLVASLAGGALALQLGRRVVA